MSLVARTSLLAALLLVACGGSSSNSEKPSLDISTLFPADNEVPGWTRADALRVLPAATAGAGYGQGGVNGDADAFVARGLVQLGIQRFAKGNAQLELRVWQMADAAAELAVWTFLTTSDPRYSGAQWTAQSLGDAGRIANTGTYWWLVTRKGAYQVEATIQPSDATARTDVVTFVGAVLAKIP
jgi:hypothetical protein